MNHASLYCCGNEYLFSFFKDEFGAKTAKGFQIGLNNTQGPARYTWKWSDGAPFYNNLSMKFSLNNFDGYMRSCPVGHCCVMKVKNSTVGAYDNCCLRVASYYICSKDIN
jgi:hypothetical protein